MRFLFIINLLFFTSAAFAQPGTTAINQVDAKGKKQGAWKKSFEDGKPRYEGCFKDDVPIGTFKYYYPQTGEINVVNEFYDNGLRVRSKIYHKTGKLKAEGIYHRQKKDSLWKYYNENEALISEEWYKDSVPVGTWKRYFENGKTAEEVTLVNGKKSGPVVEYHENGALKFKGTYKDDKLNGPVAGFYANGNKLFEGTYKNGLKEGQWNFYTDTGLPEVKEFFENGRFIRKEYLNGVFTEYYDGNIPKEEVTYKNGRKNGPFKEYHEGAKWVRRIKTEADPATETPAEWEEVLEGHQIKVKGQYLNDKLHGKITWYKPDGSIEKVENYNEGVKVE